MNIEVRFKKLHIWAFISKNTQIRTILSTILIDIWGKNRYNELGKLISRGCKQIYLLISAYTVEGKGGGHMATESILYNVTIKGNKAANALAKALEQSETAAKEKPSVSAEKYRQLNKNDIKKIFSTK